jgi:DNA-binding NtrC family response regulator
MRILIVEDQQYVSSLLADAVRLQGHEVIVAGGGQEGLAFLDREHPDAVFLDIIMPDPDGVEVLRRIRQRSPELPVVVITGGASARQREDLLRLGVTDFVEKPLLLDQIQQTLNNVVRLSPRGRGRDQEGR